jgi:Spy/CpxP family protein refolding chaperone
MKVLAVLLAAAAISWGQRPDRPPPGGRIILDTPPGKWWTDADLAHRLNLTSGQQKRMDDIFQQSRLKLLDQNAAVRHEEAILEPLAQADSPDDSRILAQIDRIAQARAELEKTHARFLLELRHVLTVDQWKKLQAEGPPPPPPPHQRPE